MATTRTCVINYDNGEVKFPKSPVTIALFIREIFKELQANLNSLANLFFTEICDVQTRPWLLTSQINYQWGNIESYTVQSKENTVLKSLMSRLLTFWKVCWRAKTIEMWIVTLLLKLQPLYYARECRLFVFF